MKTYRSCFAMVAWTFAVFTGTSCFAYAPESPEHSSSSPSPSLSPTAPAGIRSNGVASHSASSSSSEAGKPSATTANASGNPAIEKFLDRIVERERLTLEALSQRTPLIETYIQETPGGESPTKDHYFLGRFRLAGTVNYEGLIAGTDSAAGKAASRLARRSSSPRTTPLSFLPRGFAQMAVIDLQGFNRQTYRFEYVRREFMGEVRCLVFDLEPLNRSQPGKFIGRIWVEEHDAAIVRFSGTYIPVPTPKGALPELYFHFDSWRVHVGGALWAPAQIYVEEQGADPGFGVATRFKAQSRIWDYAATPGRKTDELTSILVEGGSAIKDEDVSKDVSPLESQRSWEHQAEENLIARLEKGGFLAPTGPVDEVLNTVVNNLIISSKLGVNVRCRVLLTTPIETFAIGRTIVISRGLIDVLPDEASLALVLADQLAHIALGHHAQTQYAFTDQTMVSDPEVLQLMRFQRTSDEMAAAGKKTVEIIKASPYKDTSNAGLFLKALGPRAIALPHLLHANLGDQIADPQSLARLQQFADSAPALEENKLEQIAALPLGSRMKVNPWNNAIELIKTRPLSLLSPREKMPFEVTPFALYLTRLESAPRP